MPETRSPVVIERYFRYLENCNPERFISKTTRLDLLLDELTKARGNVPINKLSLLDLGCGSPEGSRRWSVSQPDEYLPDLCVMAAQLGFARVVGVDLYNPDPKATYRPYPNLTFIQADLIEEKWRNDMKRFVAEYGKFDCIQSLSVFNPTVEALYPLKADVTTFCRTELLTEGGVLFLS